MCSGAHSAHLDPVRLAASERAESPLRGLALGLSFPGCKPGERTRGSRAPPGSLRKQEPDLFSISKRKTKKAKSRGEEISGPESSGYT